jgi:acyl-[acyl-carrier-protein] desaturase
MIEKIALDEERHELFFSNLVRWCLQYDDVETIRALAARAAELAVPGADIDAYPDKLEVVAKAGIFGPEQLRQVISDELVALGLADEAALAQFVTK